MQILRTLEDEQNSAVNCFRNNNTIVNPDKFQGNCGKQNVSDIS